MRRILLTAAAALGLSACGGGGETTANNDMNAMAVDNMLMDQNAMMMNDMNVMGGMDANVATNATTENMMMNDMMSNNPDTNLANGM